MSYDSSEYKKLRADFDLICGVVKQPVDNNNLKVNLCAIENMIQNTIPDVLKQNAPDNFYELYSDFKLEYEKFKDFILYDDLIGKNIIALGGGFSSGKSSFLNAIMGKNVLPADIDPSTSVPTYIVSGVEHKVSGINVFDARTQMKIKDIRKVAHGFGQQEDDEELGEGVKLGHILESVFFATPLHQYANIAFLDTPGYSKPDTSSYALKTDEQIARSQLNASNYILWFVQADEGTITEEDIKFIRTLREDIPKLIIVNKADKKHVTDLQRIVKQIRETLDLKGVRYTDVRCFTSRMEQMEGEEFQTFIGSEVNHIKTQIERWNAQIYEANFARNFKILFTKCKSFYEEEINIESRQLIRLNTSITKLAAEQIDVDILEPLQIMVKTVQRQVNELKERQNILKELQNTFFGEIKRVADIVGITMPEPSEIDLIQDKIQNPVQILEQYKKTNGIKNKGEYRTFLNEQLVDMKLEMLNNIGGSQYNSQLLTIIEELKLIPSEMIKINEVYHNENLYVAIMNQ